MMVSIRITPIDYNTSYGGDHANSVRFCEWLQPRPHILRDILFTDKAQFTRDGTIIPRISHP
jgi:hypothetical protein